MKLDPSAKSLLELLERLVWAEEGDGGRLFAVRRYGRRKKQHARSGPPLRHPVPEGLYLEEEVLPRRGERAHHGRAELARTSAQMAPSLFGRFGVGDAGLDERLALVSDLGEGPDLALVQRRRNLVELKLSLIHISEPTRPY